MASVFDRLKIVLNISPLGKEAFGFEVFYLWIIYGTFRSTLYRSVRVFRCYWFAEVSRNLDQLESRFMQCMCN